MKARRAKIILLTRVGQRYQVTIPKEVRQAIGLNAGDLVEARPGKGGIVLYPKVDSDIVNIEKRLAELRRTSRQVVYMDCLVL